MLLFFCVSFGKVSLMANISSLYLASEVSDRVLRVPTGSAAIPHHGFSHQCCRLALTWCTLDKSFEKKGLAPISWKFYGSSRAQPCTRTELHCYCASSPRICLIVSALPGHHLWPCSTGLVEARWDYTLLDRGRQGRTSLSYRHCVAVCRN